MHRPKRHTPAPPRHRAALPWVAAALALSWALGATYLIVFHDDVLAGFVARQGALRDAYEARIAGLQDRLDRDRGDRDGAAAGLAERIAAALERQADLERRAAALTELDRQALDRQALDRQALDRQAPAIDPLTTGGLPPRPEPGGSGFALRPAEDGAPPGAGLRPLPRRSAIEVETGLIRLEARLAGLQALQGARLAQVTARAGHAVRLLRGLIAQTGLGPGRFDLPRPSAGLGGPLVPLDPRALDASGFADGLALARRALEDGARLRAVAAALPLSRPIRGDTAVSSPFGTRLDPFTRGLALHTGLDLKAEYGEPARATAPGRVIAAESAGGYGNMVEIDHGAGLTTRFGHLARIAVRPGQHVATGEVVGAVGSTGRSTGTHLHYETRIDGEPVDPQRFLDAGAAFATARSD